MNLKPNNPPRTYKAGEVTISDCGSIELQPDEQITLRGANDSEYDIVRKPWGYYATPSLNGRLLNFGLHAALIANENGKYFITLCEDGKEEEFLSYLESENSRLVRWLDSNANLQQLEKESGA